ncbi:PASTA domain-containing protein, partial [Kurthia sp. Dielmo]|uniref:PASTA domain-containing protein n=1 Tax=Kurthia sp. Dielmo TaxID=1033738 RepID=UPI0005CA8CC5
YPEKGEIVLEGARLFLKTDSDIIQLPSFKGWSLRDVLTYQSLSGHQFTIKGEGFVTKQSLPEGTTLDADSKLTLTLKQTDAKSTKKQKNSRLGDSYMSGNLKPCPRSVFSCFILKMNNVIA